MQKMKHGILIGAAAILLVLLAAGCDLLGEDEAADTSPSVGSVDQVQLEGEASTTDFGTLSSNYGLPTDKAEALYLAVLGLGQIEEHVDAQFTEGWEPANSDSTFDLQPEELLSGELADPPSQIVLEAILKNETIGKLGADARADADVAISWNADELPTRITGTAAGRLDVEMNEAIMGTYTDVQDGSMHAALDVAVDVIMDGWRTVDTEDLPSSVSVAYAVSLKVSSAMSVETEGQADSPLTESRAGNLLISGEVSAGQTLTMTQEMIDDPQLLEDYLEEELQEPEFTMSIAVYNSSGSPETTYEYDVDYFAQLAEEEQI